MRKMASGMQCENQHKSPVLPKCHHTICGSCTHNGGRSARCQHCHVTTIFVGASNYGASDFQQNGTSTCARCCELHSNRSEPESSSVGEHSHTLSCCACAPTCSTSPHNMVTVGNYLIEHDTEVSKQKELRSLLHSLSERLESHISLHSKVADARRQDLNTLKKTKKQIMNALSDACENAEYRLIQCYETLETKALEFCSAASNLKKKIRELDERCDAALTSHNDSALGSVPQPSEITSSLQALADEVGLLKDPIDPSKLIGNRTCLPSDMNRILREWMGQPKLICDDLCCSVEQLLVCDRSAKSVAPAQPLLFNAASVQIEHRSGFWDVSLTEDGHLLMAAGSAGLIEYNLSGREERRWKPPGCRNQPEDLVCSVAALSAGRAAVGVRQHRCGRQKGQKRLKDCNAVSTKSMQAIASSSPQPVVLLLKRNDGESERDSFWMEFLRLDCLQEIPMSISTHGEVLAVTMMSGRLELVTVDSAKRYGAKNFEYRIQSATVTDQLIVILSSSKVKDKTGCRSAHVADAFKLEDALQCVTGNDEINRSPHWRYKLGREEQALDACVDAACRVLYVAVRGRDWSSSSRVCAISAEDGTELWGNVVQCSAGLMPYKLSVKGCEQRCVMVALCYDKVKKVLGRTGTIHKSVSS